LVINDVIQNWLIIEHLRDVWYKLLTMKTIKTKRPATEITVDAKIHFGKPVVADTRIPVYAVLELVEAGISFEKIITKYYPDLTIKDVKACIDYAIRLIKAEEVHITPS
jgi:uncharacterized protein (DUF433 family)